MAEYQVVTYTCGVIIQTEKVIWFQEAIKCDQFRREPSADFPLGEAEGDPGR